MPMSHPPPNPNSHPLPRITCLQKMKALFQHSSSIDNLSIFPYASEPHSLASEQEITGDLVLELDVNLLKSAISAMAFGKRVAIANAITDLRREPSIKYSDHHISSSEPSSPTQPQHSNLHSWTQPGHHSFPGITAPRGTWIFAESSKSLGNSIAVFHGYGMFAFGNQFGTVREDALPPAGPAERDKCMRRCEWELQSMWRYGFVSTMTTTRKRYFSSAEKSVSRDC